MGIDHEGNILQGPVKITTPVKEWVVQECFLQVMEIAEKSQVINNDIVFIKFPEGKGENLTIDDNNGQEKNDILDPEFLKKIGEYGWILLFLRYPLIF